MNDPIESNSPEGAVDLPRLVRLARQCPRQYPPSGEWGAIPANIELSIALREEGFPFLSKAVLEGKTWARRIASAETIQTVQWSEEEALAPGWSWNFEPNTVGQTTAQPLSAPDGSMADELPQNDEN